MSYRYLWCPSSNGLVLIITKTGKAGRIKIDFDTCYGIQNLLKNSYDREQMSFTYEHRRNTGTCGHDVFDIWTGNPYLNHYDGTDWQDELFQQAPM